MTIDLGYAFHASAIKTINNMYVFDSPAPHPLHSPFTCTAFGINET